MPEHPDFDTPASARGLLRRFGTKVAAIGVALALVAAAVAFNEVRGAGAQPRVVTVTGGDRPPAAPVDLSSPFTGTPAAAWADGAAGVTVPPAAAVGPFTAKQVAEAYARVRQAVVVSRLDRAVLERHDVERYLALLAKDSQRNMRPVFADNPPEAHAYATRLAAGFRLLPAEPKVSGRMWAEQGTRPGELVVHTNYVFAYAFGVDDPARLTDPMDIVAVDRWDVDYSVLSGGYAASSLGVWPVRSQGFTYSMGCDALRRGFLAPAYSEPRSGAAASRDRGSYFDPAGTLPTTSTCG